MFYPLFKVWYSENPNIVLREGVRDPLKEQVWTLAFPGQAVPGEGNCWEAVPWITGIRAQELLKSRNFGRKMGDGLASLIYMIPFPGPAFRIFGSGALMGTG